MTNLERILTAALLFTAGTAHADDLSPSDIASLVSAGTILSVEALDAKVLETYPGGRIDDGEIERHPRGYVYEVEVIDAKGQEWELDVDATNGTIVKTDRD